MTSALSGFKAVERGFKDTLVLIPGWATDYRIFASLDLPYNYVFPIDVDCAYFVEGLSKFVDTASVDRVALFGWSQGGFLASDFAAQYPHKVDTLILAGIRKRYDHKLLDEIRLKLKKNTRAFLYKFYLDCFTAQDAQSLSWFKEHLLNNYLDQMSLDGLMHGLEYLSGAEINVEGLAEVRKIRIFHGAEDTIAPLQESQEIASRLPQAECICLYGAGHCVFLHPDFRAKFDG